MRNEDSCTKTVLSFSNVFCEDFFVLCVLAFVSASASISPNTKNLQNSPVSALDHSSVPKLELAVTTNSANMSFKNGLTLGQLLSLILFSFLDIFQTPQRRRLLNCQM